MAIQIIAKKDGFRRCKIAHVGTRVYPDGFFTATQLKQLKAEPMLVVNQVPDSQLDDEPKGKGKGKDSK